METKEIEKLMEVFGTTVQVELYFDDSINPHMRAVKGQDIRLVKDVSKRWMNVFVMNLLDDGSVKI